MTYSVVFSPEATAELLKIYRHIAGEASPEIAKRFTDAIVAHCERFREFPERAVRRDDIRPGLHLTNYKGRVEIAFVIDATTVSILGVFYGGRDYETLLRADLEN
jgi:plasmid stabilization system protein ParE